MLKVYNTMTRRKEEFKPLKEGEVSIYCCGVTPYNHPHIGNARPFVTWDVIRRYFAKKGYKVRYIQNFTDVDDKIINTANKEGVTWKEISDRYIKAYFEAMDALNVRHADVYPRVSETMPDIIAMVQKLIDKGYAYVVDNGDVYYSVEKFSHYGRLSGRSLDDMQAGARIEVNTAKHHPMDFALWKAAKPGEPSWDSPWGKGRPGWHIECSTMSLKYLGKKFDFHGGGSDLIFPHHENEIAQSQACIGDDHSFAQYWLHNGFITIHNEKMSKSKNNFFTVKDILKEYPGEVIRFFILQTHYRSPLDFSDERLKEAQTSLGRLQNTKEYVDELLKKQGTSDTAKELAAKAEELKKAFYDAMDDDFNTALAISQMFALSKDINIYYQDVVNGGKAFDAENFKKVSDVYAEMAEIIGIFEQQDKAADDGLTDKLMDIIITLRQDARREKNWAVADKIRDALKDAGVVLEDTPNGVRWKKGMKFTQFKLLVDMMFTPDENGGIKKRYEGTDVRQMNPLVLAYVGDAVFHLFVRTRLLAYEQAKVHALHAFSAQIVSAVWQHKAYLGIESMLTEEEKAIYRRGRNAKSHAPRSSSVAEYHSSTGFEALLGTLYLTEQFERLEEVSEAAFEVISKAMMQEIHDKKTEEKNKA